MRKRPMFPSEWSRRKSRRTSRRRAWVALAVMAAALVFASYEPISTGLEDGIGAILGGGRFTECGRGERINCVVDGDTFWFEGEKIRIADINTPEISQPACAREKQLGEEAGERLLDLLNEGPFTLERAGRDKDRYGRLLRTVHRDGESLGDVLVREGLAEEWQGRRGSWC